MRTNFPKNLKNVFALLLLSALLLTQFPSNVFATDLTTSLISYWKLDETSGTRADSVGSNNLTDNNTVTQAVGKLGNSAQFTIANSEYLSHIDNASLSIGSTDFTISAWVYLDTKTSNMVFVSKYGGGGGNGEYALYYKLSADAFACSTFPQLDASVTPPGGVQTGQWYFLTCSHNATTHTNTITVNNTWTNTSAAGTEPSDTIAEFAIGRFQGSGSTMYFNGRVDSVGFWKRILAAGEITTLYNSGAGLEYPFSTLSAGTVSLTTRTDSSIGLSSTDATGGTAPYTYQWYRSTSSGFTPGAGNILSGKTSLTLSDTGLSAGTTYYYKIRFTDSASATIDSSEFSAVTLAPPATSFTFTGPSSGTVDTTSTNFTVTPNGEYTGTITPSSTGSGTFSPTSLTWSGASDAKTFTYTPSSTSGSPHTISVSSSPSLTNSSGNISFTVNAKTTYYQILSTGQSLATVYYATPAISTSQPYNNLMLTPGVEGTSAPLIPLVESGQGEGGNVETISSGMANTLHALENLVSPITVGLHAHSGTAYSGLKKGTSWYNKGMTQASVTKTYIENTLGGIYRPLAITSIHGESDYVAGTGANYENDLTEWQSDYQNDLNALTGRSDTIPLFINQMNSAPTGTIADAELSAHINNPGKVILVEPKYQYHYRSDKLHMDVNTQEKQMGEMFAKVMSKVLFKGQTWNPLMPSSITRSGNIITISYQIPYGTLAIDTTNVAARPSNGFEFAQTGGNSVSISSVELINNNSQVKITLSDTPTGTNQRLRYAWSCYVAATWCAQAGDATAVGGNIRDTDTSVSPSSDSTGLPLYDWGVTFNEPITTTYSISSSAGANGTISPSGATTVNSGSDQSFTITPSAHYHVADVLVDSVSVGAVSSYNFTNVTTDHTISATFAIDTKTLTYTAGTNGSITGTSPQTINYGSDGSTVTAVPDTGYHFVNWSDSSTTNPRTDTNVTDNISVTANFAINTFTLTYVAGTHGTISGTSPQTVNYGANGSAVTAVADSGYHFTSWDDGGLAAERTDTNITANHTYTANFEATAPTTYSITASAGSHGSISPSGATTVNSGDNQSYNITADSGYHVSNVLVDGSSVGAVSSYTFNTVTADHTISATFAVTSSGGGGCYNCFVNPVIPTGGFKMSINGGVPTTSNRNVFLGFTVGADIKKMAISMTGDFTDASQESYVASKQWDLCSKLGGAVKNPTCPDGKYTVYAKFYTAYGRSSDASIASSTITLQSGSVTENLQKYTNLPFTNPFTKYLQYRQTNNDVKRLQIFLNSDPDTKIADTGAGSPGKETNYFGILTYKAVIKFQEKYAKDILDPWGFKKGTGYVGKTTLAKINELMKNK